MLKTKKIYILQMHTKTMPARLIRLFTRYEYSHIALSFDKSCDVMYSFGRKKYNSILNGGFVELHRNGKFFEKFNNTKCRIFEIEIPLKRYKKLEKIINKYKVNENKYKYDYIGIILRYFKLPISFENKYVCSYFIGKILEDSKILKFNKKTYFIQPKDFEHIDNVKEIYVGKYLLYK